MLRAMASFIYLFVCLVVVLSWCRADGDMVMLLLEIRCSSI